jgi:hypothetical protein
MQVKYVIIIIIILLFLCLNLSHNNQKVEKMNSTIKPFDNQSSNLIIPKLKLLKSGEKIEILDLPYCKKDFKVEYGSNINYILNDGKKIYQDILKPNEQQAFIDAKKQGLTQVSWKKSIFTYNNKKVPLELQLTHLDSKTGKITKIIYPLSLESDTKENFSNLSKKNKKLVKKNKKLTKKNKKRAKKILDEKGKLSLLLQKPSDIPSLIKGQVNTGKIKNFNVCDDEKYYIEQNKFFMAESPNNETILIAKPIKFDKQLGLTILKNLGEPDNDFIKP